MDENQVNSFINSFSDKYIDSSEIIKIKNKCKYKTLDVNFTYDRKKFTQVNELFITDCIFKIKEKSEKKITLCNPELKNIPKNECDFLWKLNCIQNDWSIKCPMAVFKNTANLLINSSEHNELLLKGFSYTHFTNFGTSSEKTTKLKKTDIEKLCSSFKLETDKTVCLAADLMNGRNGCLLYTSPSPRDRQKSRMPSSA